MREVPSVNCACAKDLGFRVGNNNSYPAPESDKRFANRPSGSRTGQGNLILKVTLTLKEGEVEAVSFLLKGGNYSRAASIQGNTLIARTRSADTKRGRTV